MKLGGSVLLVVVVLAVAGALSSSHSSPAGAVASSTDEHTAAAASTTAPAEAPTPTKPLPRATKPCGSEGQPDSGVSVNASTSCPFAMAVLKAYVQAGWEPDAPKAATISAYSPVTHQTYSMACAAANSETIACAGGNEALVSFQIAAGTRVALEATEATRQTPEHPSEETDEVGSSSHAGDSGFCEEHRCIGNFTTEDGTVVECADGSFSHAGGIYGACSYHGGEAGGGGGQYSEGEGKGEEESSPE